MNAFGWYGACLIALLLSAPIWFRLFIDRGRNLAREVAALLVDGRPRGCKCPPNPGMNALPSDNKHINSPRCPLTTPDELVELRRKVADLELALSVLAPPQGG